MSDSLHAAVEALQERFGAQLNEFRGEMQLQIAPEHLVDACQMLRDEFQFNILESETASDYWPEVTPRFHVVYQVYSLPHNARVCLRVPLDGDFPVMHTLEGIFPNANWHEREIWDMFGIRFEGHSDMRRILMPHDWEGHPLRKDYPLGYEEPQFTFNFDDIQVRKHKGRYEEA